ncbi:uncharacterized protein LOC111380876 [Olea europaea var. sylvestris]|uniref:uncharacterized protein LOC111380876 n=1 Tax=Olea europaea var. sylvestris TaxID=158386 RepID=UPI000C1D3ED4|nr:uncharacterized protein LOC111380876 [Olea europaea var. sylvestris]
MAEQDVRAANEDNQQRAIRDYIRPVVNDNYSGIAHPAIAANNFELKPGLIHMVQQNHFGGAAVEDQNAHLGSFLEICDTVKMNGVTEDAIRLRLFSFSLRDKAKAWFQSLPYGSITTWDDLAQKFLTKYFPPSKSTQLHSEISQFKQLDFEPFYEAWERFKDLLRRCPQHGFQKWMQIEIFYNGLNGQTRTMVDAAAGGILMAKTAEAAYALLDDIATNSYQWPSERSGVKKVAGFHEVDPITALAAQVASLTNQIVTLTTQGNQQKVDSIMSASSSNQETEVTNEQAQYVDSRNYNQRGSYQANHYHPGLRNHKNLSYGNNRNTLQPPPEFNTQNSDGKPPLEDILGTFISETRSRFNKNELRWDNIETHVSNMGATMKNLEVQIGQLATSMKSQQKGKFPIDTEVNPREHCNAIILRSGKMVEESKPKKIVVPTSDVIVTEERQSERQKTEAEGTKIYKPYSLSFPDNPPILKPPLPFPQRFMKKKFDDQFAKFLEVFKKIHINIPFAEALAQMPNYAKFLKEVMSNKKKLEEFETIKLTEGCSDILQKLPHKLKDSGSFNIPCNIGGITFDRALCDLGASINLMPLSVFKKLGLAEVKPTTLTLQLADRSITYPKCMIEDVLVKVDKFILHVDFVVLDMDENEKISLILGRPFLATGRALIDVQEGKLTLRFNEEHVTFNIHQVEKPQEKVNICNMAQSAEAVLGYREKRKCSMTL